jgi:hypothetical protein
MTFVGGSREWTSLAMRGTAAKATTGIEPVYTALQAAA